METWFYGLSSGAHPLRADLGMFVKLLSGSVYVVKLRHRITMNKI